MKKHGLYIRINGSAHAFSREIGCNCNRCRTVTPLTQVPDGGLTPFAGWNDPPWRANTSVSILCTSRKGDRLQYHILLDAGAGVNDSLALSGIPGIEDINILLLTHWHHDHTSGITRIIAPMLRKHQNRETGYRRIKAIGSEETIRRLRIFYPELENTFVNYHTLTGGETCSIPDFPGCRIFPIEVAHSSVEGAMVFAIEIKGKKLLFFWDINTPDSRRPLDGKTNLEAIKTHGDRLKEADILFLSANTWEAEGTGHTSFIAAQPYLELLKPRMTYLLHLSGHEDRGKGYGLTDKQWDDLAATRDVLIAKQGMIIEM